MQLTLPEMEIYVTVPSDRKQGKSPRGDSAAAAPRTKKHALKLLLNFGGERN